MSVGVQQQQRRATEAAWLASGKVLAAGEIGFATDSKVIKMGDGVNTWGSLSIPYDGRYLPIGGKAADSEMLDGISSAGFLLVGDAAAAATAGKLILRDGSGRGKVVAGAATGDIVEFDQMVAADVANKYVSISRTVTAAFTLAATDVGKTILVDNSSYTTFAANINTNALVAIPTGSVIKIITTNKGPITLTPAGGVTLTGPTALPGGVSSVTLGKTGTDAWLVLDIRYSPGPVLRRRIKFGSDNAMLTGNFVPLRLDGADSGTGLYANNYDSLGTNEQYNSGSDLYKAFARRAGWYDVHAQFSLGNANTGRFYCQVKVNGIDQDVGSGFSRGGQSEITASCTTPLALNVGDEVRVYGYQDGSGTDNVSVSPYAASFFAWEWRRPL
jgi:Major tropism determinant N-terminal domain